MFPSIRLYITKAEGPEKQKAFIYIPQDLFSGRATWAQESSGHRPHRPKWLKLNNHFDLDSI